MRRALLLFAVLFALARPLEADLPGYDDAYYARKALETLRSGDWLALPFNGSPTFDNPPLGIWVQALAIGAFGPADAAARVPSAVYGVLTVLLTAAWAGRRFRAPEAAFFAGALVLTNPLFLKYLRRGMLDMGLLFWGLAGAVLAERRPLSRPLHALSGAAFGLAFLTKSSMALIFPASLALGWWLEGTEGRRRLRAWALPALAGFAAIVLPWGLAMTARFGEPFLRGHFVWLLWGEGVRGVSDTARLGTLAEAVVLLSPAIVLFMIEAMGWVRSGWRGRSSGREPLRPEPVAPAVAGAAAFLLALGVGARKLWYFLPALPGMAVAAGGAVARWSGPRPGTRRLLVRGTLAAWTLAAAAILLLPVPLHLDRTSDLRAIAAEVRARTGEGTPVTLWFPGEVCRWEVRNAFLWYADRPLQGCAGETPVRDRGLAAGREWVLTGAAGLEAIRASGERILIWAERGDLRLLTRERG